MTIATTMIRAAALPAVTLVAASLVARANEAQRPQMVRTAQAMVLACSQAGPIDQLTLDSDYTVFMRDDCPNWARRAALRRLWRLLPPTEVPENSAI